MHKINTEIIINAPISKIWDTLMDFDSYSSWNPFIRIIEGNKGVGERLNVTVIHDNNKPMALKPIILSMSNYEFLWRAKLGMPGLFAGEHLFKLVQETDTSVKFIHLENFSGILSKPIFALIHKSTKTGFENMNLALKKKCEV